MKMKLISDAISGSLHNAFEKMLGANVDLLDSPTDQATPTRHDAMAVIGMGGEGMEATLNLLFAERSAEFIVKVMLEEVAVDGAETVRDGIGEFANLIAGGIKARFHSQGIDVTLGLPSVVIAQDLKFSTSAVGAVHPFRFAIDGKHIVDGLFVIREAIPHGEQQAELSSSETKR
ncbi:MAG: chemotaxis protein CheX [Planctomycetota bacterium]